jgi:hypothetical protein
LSFCIVQTELRRVNIQDIDKIFIVREHIDLVNTFREDVEPLNIVVDCGLIDRELIMFSED